MGDSDMSTVKEGMTALVGEAAGKNDAMSMVKLFIQMLTTQSRGSGLDLASWESDLQYAKRRLVQGPKGAVEELHDTMLDVRHLDEYGHATRLLRSFIEIALVYLAFGALYKSYMTDAKGIQCIPHVGFWMQLPSLVQDGITYSQIL